MCKRQPPEGARQPTLVAQLISKNHIHNYYFSKRKLKVAFCGKLPVLTTHRPTASWVHEVYPQKLLQQFGNHFEILRKTSSSNKAKSICQNVRQEEFVFSYSLV